jgi:predicted enzyme related to lactoylglutathione lyase
LSAMTTQRPTRQQALFDQGQPAAMFYTGDLKAAYERMKHAAEFNRPPTKVKGSTIAQANDTFGNLIRITQLDRVRSEAGRS